MKNKTRWEYRKDFMPNISCQFLNTLGNDGWELVTTIPNTMGGAEFYFKREKNG